MILWRNILPAICLVCCCTPLFAQEIDYSKCSCDSLFIDIFKVRDNYIKSYSDNYQGKRRYIENNKCITTTDLDSIIVRYENETLWISESDSTKPKKLLLTIKTDSTVFHKKNNNIIYEVELYQRKVSDLEVEYKYFKKDFGLELRLKLFKSIAGKDSAFYYYSEKGYAIIREAENSNKIAWVYLASIPIKYTFTIDTDGYIHGRYIAYCPNGEIMNIQTFSHGVKNGYFYYATACKMFENEYGEKLKKGKYYSMYYNNESNSFEYEKGHYNNGERKGKWITKQEKPVSLLLVESDNFKKYILKHRNDKTYLRKFFIYKQIEPPYFFDLYYSNNDLYDMIKYVNLLYRSYISDLTEYRSDFQKKHGPYFDIIKLKER